MYSEYIKRPNGKQNSVCCRNVVV